MIVAKLDFFGTDGIRGIANRFPVTPQVALTLGRAAAHVLAGTSDRQPKVVVGGDARMSSNVLKMAAAAGFSGAGANVLVYPTLTTPALAQELLLQGVDCGLMVTASHNPPEYNGFKLFNARAQKLSTEEELLIENRLKALLEQAAHDDWESSIGKIEMQSDCHAYCEWLCRSLAGHDFGGMRCVFDCANGGACFVAPQVVSRLDLDAVWIGNHPDGNNTGVGCGALHPEALGEAVRSHRAAIGFAFDGDADRLVVVDEEGIALPGDLLIAGLALMLREEGKLVENGVVLTIMSNLGVVNYLREEGMQVTLTDVGDKHVAEAMRANQWSLGGEESGHVILGDYAPGGDGLLVALHLLRGLQRTGLSLRELRERIPLYPRRLCSVTVTEKRPLEECPHIQGAKHAMDETMAGKGRIVVRYSGTEPKLRVLVEAQTSELVEKSLERMLQAIEKDLTLCR